MTTDTDKQATNLHMYYCYAQEDHTLVKIFDQHLASWKRQGLMSVWQEDDVFAGADWKRERNRYLMSSDIVLLFVSADFLDSDFCYGEEMQRLIERHDAGVTLVIPILLSPATWEFTRFGHLPSLPANGRTIVEQKDRDAAFADVAQQIHVLAEKWNRSAITDTEGQESVTDSLQGVLHRFRYLSKFYVGTSIPARKAANARAICKVLENEPILGLLDLTVFGSAKNCMLFSNRGMYYHHMSGRPKFETIPYADFPLHNFQRRGIWSIDTGDGSHITLGGNSLPPQDLCKMLNAIKQVFTLAQRTPLPVQNQPPSVFSSSSFNSLTTAGEETATFLSARSADSNIASSEWQEADKPKHAYPKPTPRQKRMKMLVINLFLLALLVGAILLLRTVIVDTATTDAALATATAQSSTTATATANIVAENPDPYPPYSGTLTLYDPLSSPLHWSSAVNGDYGSSCQFTGNFLDVRQSKAPRLSDCVDDQDFTNFAVEVQMRVLVGNCGGINLRYNLGYVSSQTYAFLVCSDGTYSIIRFTSSGERGITSSFSQAIHKGKNQLNLVAVVVNGGQLTIYVNGTSVYSLSDSTPHDCKIGLLALDLSTPDEVAYTNAKVWTL